MLKRKNESQSSMVNHNWPPAILRHRPLETDFVRDGFAVLESFVNKVELKKIVPLVETVVTSSHELACTRPHNTLAPLRWNDPIVGLLLKSDRRVQALTDVLRADDLKWISGYVSIKEPHSPPLWVASGLVVLGSSAELSANGPANSSSLLSGGHKCTKRCSPGVAGFSSQERTDPRNTRRAPFCA